jgi:hypothetical protein
MKLKPAAFVPVVRAYVSESAYRNRWGDSMALDVVANPWSGVAREGFAGDGVPNVGVAGAGVVGEAGGIVFGALARHLELPPSLPGKSFERHTQASQDRAPSRPLRAGEARRACAV